MIAAAPLCAPVDPPGPFDIVVIAASLGGPTALRDVVAGLPAGFPAAVVVVQHRSALVEDVAVDLLRRRTPLDVGLALPGARPRAGRIDIAPASRQLRIGPDGGYALEARPSPTGCAADPLLASVADRFGPRAIVVILSGTLDDGAAGVSALKRRGGWALAQDSASARCFGMPAAAIATGCVDYVLPLSRIADALVALTMRPGAADLFRVPSPFWAQAAP